MSDFGAVERKANLGEVEWTEDRGDTWTEYNPDRLTIAEHQLLEGHDELLVEGDDGITETMPLYDPINETYDPYTGTVKDI